MAAEREVRRARLEKIQPTIVPAYARGAASAAIREHVFAWVAKVLAWRRPMRQLPLPAEETRASAQSKILLWIAVAAGLTGTLIGVWYGNLGRAVKVPGEAYQTDDESGSWVRYVLPGAEAKATTQRRLRLVEQALLAYALSHGGLYPETLQELVDQEYLRTQMLLDGRDRPGIYTTEEGGRRYLLRTAQDASRKSGPSGEAETP